jgi:hypothetical protein
MAFTEVDITALKAAIAQGALRVRFGEREVTYRSLAEMKEILGMMESEVAVSDGRTRTRQVRFQTSKGL